MTVYMLKRCLAITAALAAMTVLAADANNVDAGKSTVIATFKQEGVAVDAPFRKFTGRIVYDAKNVATATAAVDVEVGSLDIGDEAYNAEVRKPAWFDAAKYPLATFRSTAIKPVSATRFDATGKLTVKGKVLTITIPITLKDNAFDGALSISRKSFGIGDPLWEGTIDDKVAVRFHIVSSGH